jgi:hypothetical protein
MGIIRSNAAFLLDARARGVVFDRTLTLGRQRLYVRPDELRALAAQYRADLHDAAGGLRYGEPADAFLTRFLDVRELHALDRSAYEGAGVTHDMNLPIPAALEERFDAVVDSGTLEHIFNVPVALANCMKLAKRGGSVFLASPANNMCGHGFYQFSPELFFRVFSAANGFSLTRLVLVTHPFPGAELSARQTWYEVRDPAEIGARAPLMTKTPAFLMMEAKRVDAVPSVLTAPQQSDYVSRWDAVESPPPAAPPRSALRAMAARLPPGARAWLTGWYQRGFLCTLRNGRAFRKL